MTAMPYRERQALRWEGLSSMKCLVGENYYNNFSMMLMDIGYKHLLYDILL